MCIRDLHPAEFARLQDAYASPGAQLVLLYGRRGIGKTVLLQKFCEEKPAFSFWARPYPDAFQRKTFSEAVAKFCGTPGVAYPDYVAAFGALAVHSAKERKVIVIDAIENIVADRPGFLDELRALWESSLAREDIMLILSGRGEAFNVYGAAGAGPVGRLGPDEAPELPFFGTGRTVLELRPVTMLGMRALAPDLSAEELFRGYAVLGGMPSYWRNLREDCTMTEISPKTSCAKAASSMTMHTR